MPEWVAIWILVTIGLLIVGFFVGVFSEDADAGIEIFLGILQLSAILFVLFWLGITAIGALA